MKWLVVACFLGLGLARHQPAYSCASCGSGGGDPLVLFPYERLKVFAGLGVQDTFRDIRSDGEIIRSFGVERRRTLNSAVAYRLSRHMFGSITVPLISNSRGDHRQNGIGDPLLALRYTAVRPTIINPWKPQVQVLGTYKKSISPSIHDSTRFDSLDVMGNGLDEWTTGVDLWYGMNPIVGGASYLWTAPTEKDTDFGRQRREAMNTFIVTAGYQWMERLSVIGGWRVRSHGGISLDGNYSPRSRVREESWFFTAETRQTGPLNYRFTVSQEASLGTNRNTASFWSYQLAILGRIL